MLNDSRTPQWVVDVETMRVMEANEAAALLWRYPMETLIGLDAMKFVPPEDRSLVTKAAEANRWGDAGIWRCQKGDGTIFYARLRWHQFIHRGRLCNFVFAQETREDAA